MQPKSAKVTYDITILSTSQDVFSPWLNCPLKMLKKQSLAHSNWIVLGQETQSLIDAKFDIYVYD
jgi:hypothetical protein